MKLNNANPYINQGVLGQTEFLTQAYLLMRKKVRRLIEIEESREGSLSLELIEEKFRITRNILNAIGILQNDIVSIEDHLELADILFEIGRRISLGNISKGEESFEHYKFAIYILDEFLRI